ncbi:MAG: helix-turn-helix domain-containing protein [Thermodesulfobacteriota bacterium]|nr:helix-turn-helix domain-containing protein [Thermodesulfobacteriota bacterium]
MVNSTDKTRVTSSARTRDREATRARLIEAVGTLLARKGFTAVGVNALAKEAGVDKVLIYRYFGGLQELIAAFGRESNFWPSVEELAGGDIETFIPLPLAESAARLAVNYLNAIRKRPLTQEILAWEMVDHNELTADLETMREITNRKMLEMLRPLDDKELDVEAFSAIIGATVNYLVTRSRKIRVFSGIDLGTEEGWRRMERTLIIMISRVLGASSDREK